MTSVPFFVLKFKKPGTDYTDTLEWPRLVRLYVRFTRVDNCTCKPCALCEIGLTQLTKVHVCIFLKNIQIDMIARSRSTHTVIRHKIQNFENKK